MAYQVLARKWRPSSFDDVVGQQHVLRALRHAFDRQSTHHAYLFTGTRGVGKTTLARILARCFNCEQGVTSLPCGQCSACTQISQGRYADLYEVDAASRAKVEETRDLMDKVPYSPVTGRYKVYIIDEVHMFSNHSFNALLKVLEEPPDHVRFLLATTEPKRIPATILSRCVQFGLRALSSTEIDQRLRYIMEQENVPCEADASELLAQAADGSLRDALSLLDQAISDGGGQLKTDQVRQMLGTVPKENLQELLELVVAGNGKQLLDMVRMIMEHRPDYATVLSELMNLLQAVAIEQVTTQPGEQREPTGVANLANKIPPEQVQLMYQIALHGKRDLPLASNPGNGFEMCMIRMLAFLPSDAAAAPAGNNYKQQPKSQPAKKQTEAKPESAPAAEQAAPKARYDHADLDIENLRDPHNWLQLIEHAELVAMDRQLAENCVVKSYSNNVLQLQLHGSSALAAKQDALSAKLKPILGQKLILRLDLGDSNHNAETPATMNSEKRQQQSQQRTESINQDPHVRAICNSLDATIANYDNN